ncbi:uncharacterized protein LOC141600254 isoform X2 [Silene latifolia]|uniref:uncharacterized protein LOC141600254 isoform X2 n=1 Tax=Silene latifolia TaxID=37657 RepID=UPI003D77D084
MEIWHPSGLAVELRLSFQVASSDLIAYGLIPEFLGRFLVLVNLSALTEDQLVEVGFNGAKECTRKTILKDVSDEWRYCSLSSRLFNDLSRDQTGLPCMRSMYSSTNLIKYY